MSAVPLTPGGLGIVEAGIMVGDQFSRSDLTVTTVDGEIVVAETDNLDTVLDMLRKGQATEASLRIHRGDESRSFTLIP